MTPAAATGTDELEEDFFDRRRHREFGWKHHNRDG